MKKFTLTLTLIVFVILIQSYSNKESKQYSDHITAGSNYVLVQHQISDFKTWETAFNKDENRRENSGISVILIAQENDDDNSISMVFGLKNIEKAKTFFNDPKTADLMGAAGVTSQPQFSYFNVENSSIPKGHSFMIIQHEVSDYAKWKKSFDEHDNIRRDYHIQVTAVGSYLDNTNHVIAILIVKKQRISLIFWKNLM
jgi:hypothetical protein